MAEHGLEYQGGELTAFRRKIGEKGWFGLNWPTEYGGLGLTADASAPADERVRVRAVCPGPDLTVTSMAPMIMRHGTEQNKKEFLPGIARGEIVFALGYSEPNAGTDLASLRTRAVRDGDEWVINGSKIWNSGAQRSTHEWLCVRTDPDAPRHRGISVISGAGRQSRHRDPPAVRMVGIPHQRDVLQRRARAGDQPDRRGQRGLDLHHRRAGPRARRVDQRRRPAPRARRPAVRDGGRDGRYPRVPPPPRAGRGRRRSRQADGLRGRVDARQWPHPDASRSASRRSSPASCASASPTWRSICSGPTDCWPPRVSGNFFERLYRVSPLMRFGGGTNEVLRDVIAQRGHKMPSYGR